MRRFKIQATNNITGALHDIWRIDDYFGKHKYGYVINGVDTLTEQQFIGRYTPEPHGEANE